ncbi:FeoB small GTPase domain-containing protein [Enterobacter hormaechei]
MIYRGPSLTTISSQTSLDEQIACHYILSGDADLLINVVDASNLERNLYLTLQLLELGIPCIVALTCSTSPRSKSCASTSMPSPHAWAARWFRWFYPRTRH